MVSKVLSFLDRDYRSVAGLLAAAVGSAQATGSNSVNTALVVAGLLVAAVERAVKAVERRS